MGFQVIKMFRYILIFLLIFSNISYLSAETTRYDLEAAFVYKFIKFVEWPNSFKDEEFFDVCYTGSGEIQPSIMALVDSEIKDLRLKVKIVEDLNDLQNCELLFVDISSKDGRKKYINFLSRKSVLTVSHFDGFIEEGGMINLLLKNNRIQFEINIKSAEESNIKVSSKLLRLANSVTASN